MNQDQIIEKLNISGGQFICTPEAFLKKCRKIKAFIFDWDGVFNDGVKVANAQSNATAGLSSGFSEADSMGTNMLRFSYWLHNKQTLPFIGIVTGELNPLAAKLAEREHFDAAFYKIGNKKLALKVLKDKFNFKLEEMAFVFDDVLDLPIASKAGLRFLVQRKASPIFTSYVQESGLCDYITNQEGGTHAVREITELIITAQGNYKETMDKRWQFHQAYKKYLADRNAYTTRLFTLDKASNKIIEPTARRVGFK